MAVYLASDAARMVTGQVFVIDGGQQGGSLRIMPTIVHARYALIGGEAREDYALCIEDERIAAAGKLAELTAQFPTAGPESAVRNTCSRPASPTRIDHGRAIGTVALGAPDTFLRAVAEHAGRLAPYPAIPGRALFRPATLAIRRGQRLLTAIIRDRGRRSRRRFRSRSAAIKTRAFASPCTRQ